MMAKPPHKAVFREFRYSNIRFVFHTSDFVPALLAFAWIMGSYGQIPVVESLKPTTREILWTLAKCPNLKIKILKNINPDIQDDESNTTTGTPEKDEQNDKSQMHRQA